MDVEEEDTEKKVIWNPVDPAREEEYKAHRTDRMPYRSWCPHFITGRVA